VKFSLPITLIGAGAVGRSIALALFCRGVKLSGIYSRNGRTAKNLAKKTGAKNFGRLTILNNVEGVILIAVPDGSIPDVAVELVKKQRSFNNVIVMHTSGALASDELSLLKKKGAAIGSLHPLQTFPRKGISSFDNIWCAIEGDPPAVKAAKRLAAVLESHSFVISKEAKVLYHTAGVFASNYVITLLSIVDQIAREAQLPGKKIWDIYRPLITTSIANAIAQSPAEALTGPIARGDVETVTKHLQALSTKKLNHLVPLYAALGIETARLAKKMKPFAG